MPVALANAAQILRTIQRDDTAIKHIEESLRTIIAESAGNRGASLHILQRVIPLISKLGYYGSTTLSGNQTLGEEYVGTVLACPNLSLPSRISLLWMIMIKVLGPQFLSHILNKWETTLKSSYHSATEKEKIKIKKFIVIIKEVFPQLLILRNALFYLTGQFFDVGMWFTGIHYILIRSWLHDEKSASYFKVLGLINLIHFVVSVAEKMCKLDHVNINNDIEERSSSGQSHSKIQCYLCLETRKNTSATPCGHLFCWECIISALKINNSCPVCREKIIPSRVVILQNYDD